MATKKESSLICDYLEALGVPHTSGYSNKRVDDMAFQTFFGLSKLLEEYKIQSEGYLIEDKSEITKLPTPFIAVAGNGEVVVTEVTPLKVSYLSDGQKEITDLGNFTDAWDGRVLLSYPSPDAIEPDYASHARIQFFMRAKRWILLACALFVFVYLFIVNNIYSHFTTILIAAIDLAGVYLTYLLVQKSVKIHNPAADRVCGVLEAGGCDSILEMKASKFFGIFGWSEVGFSYFSVSLAVLLLFPSMIRWLALANLCCLPFTVWSIWYQRFRAHKWCTLCVSVQCSLWLLFFCYFFGGWLKEAWPVQLEFFVLGAVYVGVMLTLNAIMPLIEKNNDGD